VSDKQWKNYEKNNNQMNLFALKNDWQLQPKHV